MKATTHLLLPCLIFILTSCADQQEGSTEMVTYQFTELAPKVFALDNETAFDQITPQYNIIDGTGYYHFFNRQNSSLYFYNYQSGDLEHQVKLASDGPEMQ